MVKSIMKEDDTLKWLVVLIGVFSMSKSQSVFRPNLPLGEYRFVFEKIYPCTSSNNHSLKYNLYFSKKTASTVELKGNITALIPIDDSLSLDFNVASWSLTGGWKPNSLIYETKNACSRSKFLLGKVWMSALKAFNFPKTDCPLPAGTYVTSGFDEEDFRGDNRLPKVYFYGKYKATSKMRNEKNEVVGCGILELSLVRPWEIPV